MCSASTTRGARFSRLNTAAKHELARLDELKVRPRRYTFVTSRELTAGNKSALVTTLGRLVRDERDVMGAGDLAGLLREYPEVERAHVKLWLRSTAQLQRIVHAEVLARSEALLDDIRASLPRYVQTRSFAAARELLEDHRVVIVAGPPGVGKTTLARLLLLDVSEAGFVPFSVQSDVAEAWKLFSADEPQVFFFDDFLGRTALFESVGDDARDLGNFIRRVRRSESTRLILATREYVLRQARQQVEDLRWQELEADKYALTLDSYTRLERARILYNHVYFSTNVSARARRDLVADRAYLKVIDHRSYSPRLIEWMTGLGGHRLTADELQRFPDFCLSVLDNPERLWEYAYTRGLDDTARCLLLQLPGLPVAVALSDLEQAYRSAAKARGLASTRRAFEGALKVVQDSFVRVIQWPGGTVRVSVLNPSLVDFINRRLLDDPEELAANLRGVFFFEQTDYLARLALGAGRLSDDAGSVIATAAQRTLSREVPIDRPRVPGQTERVVVAARLAAVARWSSEAPRLRSDLAPVITGTIPEVISRTHTATGRELGELPPLASALVRVGFDVSSLVNGVKRRARQLGDDVDAYEALAELRRVVPQAFPIREWDALLNRFVEWASDVLDDGAAWFDDVGDLDHFEDVAAALGATLPDEELASAREDVEIAVAEREAEAREHRDPDDYRDDDDRYYRRDDVASDAYIDGLFGMFEG